MRSIPYDSSTAHDDTVATAGRLAAVAGWEARKTDVEAESVTIKTQTTPHFHGRPTSMKPRASPAKDSPFIGVHWPTSTHQLAAGHEGDDVEAE